MLTQHTDTLSKWVTVTLEAQRMSTDIDDLNAVRDAVQRYVGACTNADSEALRSALHPA